MTKRKRDPNWRSPARVQLDWYDGVLGLMRRLAFEYAEGSPLRQLRDAWLTAPLAPLPAWLTESSACSQRVLQLDWLEAKVASTHEP